MFPFEGMIAWLGGWVATGWSRGAGRARRARKHRPPTLTGSRLCIPGDSLVHVEIASESLIAPLSGMAWRLESGQL